MSRMDGKITHTHTSSAVYIIFCVINTPQIHLLYSMYLNRCIIVAIQGRLRTLTGRRLFANRKNSWGVFNNAQGFGWWDAGPCAGFTSSRPSPSRTSVLTRLPRKWERILKWEREVSVLFVFNQELVSFEGTFEVYLCTSKGRPAVRYHHTFTIRKWRSHVIDSVTCSDEGWIPKGIDWWRR